MFHSEEERSRNVDLINELQHAYGTTTTTATNNGTNSFELDQSATFDIDAIGFDLEYDLGRRDSWGTNSPSTTTVGEPQCFTTFTSEDKWPI